MHPERIKELDGIRGLAILMVFVYHIFLDNPLFAGEGLSAWARNLTHIGWAGVDVFFVLSGFLITGILLKSREKPHYYRNFYGRRILRIFPVYYIFLTIIFLVSDPASYQNLASFVIGHYLYLQNWMFAVGATALPDRLGHFWSLAIEEQFYMFWPLVVYRATPKKLLVFCAATFLAVPILRGALVFLSGDIASVQMFIFASTFTRIDGLLLGAALALLIQMGLWSDRYLPAVKWVGGISGLAALFVLYRVPGGSLWFNVPTQVIGYSLIALSSAALILLNLYGQPSSPLRALFRNPLLTFCGKYSYAMYVVHWPIIAAITWYFSQNNLTSTPWLMLFIVSCTAATTLTALLSWNLVEKNALYFKRYFEN